MKIFLKGVFQVRVLTRLIIACQFSFVPKAKKAEKIAVISIEYGLRFLPTQIVIFLFEWKKKCFGSFQMYKKMENDVMCKKYDHSLEGCVIVTADVALVEVF